MSASDDELAVSKVNLLRLDRTYCTTVRYIAQKDYLTGLLMSTWNVLKD